MPKLGKAERKILDKINQKKLKTIREEIKKGEIIIEKEDKYGLKPKYETPKELALLVGNYIEETTQKGKPITIAGLALYTGTEPNYIRNPEKTGKFYGIFHTFKTTLLKDIEERLLTDPKMVQSFRYYLENNYSKEYQTKTTSDVNLTGSISLVQLNREAEKILNAKVVKGELVE